jgi:hypothetical protein
MTAHTAVQRRPIVTRENIKPIRILLLFLLIMQMFLDSGYSPVTELPLKQPYMEVLL